MKNLLFICGVLIFFSGNLYARKIVLISDIDDTIKRTHVLGYATGGLSTENPYQGMSRLFLNFSCSPIERLERRFFCLNNRAFYHHPDRRVHYVTAAYGLLANFGRNFLIDSNFPDGHFVFKSESEQSTFEYKVLAIGRIIRSYPEATDFVLVGDNGQVDGAVFQEILRQYQSSSRRFWAYLHQIYSYAPDARQRGCPVPDGIGRFQTAFELALEFYLNEWLTRDELLNIYQDVTRYLYSTDKDYWEQVIPSWTRCMEFVQEYRRPGELFDEDLAGILDSFMLKMRARCDMLDSLK